MKKYVLTASVLGAFLTVMSCADGKYLLVKEEFHEAYISDASYPDKQKDWKAKEEPDYFYVYGSSTPNKTEVINHGTWTVAQARTAAFDHAIQQIVAHIKFEAEGTDTNRVSRQGANKEQSFTSAVEIKSAGSIEGLMLVRTYYERYTMTHKRKSYEYVRFWNQYRIHKNSAEKARKELDNKEATDRRDKNMFKSLVAEYRRIEARLKQLDRDDPEYASRYERLTDIKNRIEFLGYYTDHPDEDGYTEIVNEIKKSADDYEMTNWLKTRITQLEQDLTEEKTKNAVRTGIEDSMAAYTTRLLTAFQTLFEDLNKNEDPQALTELRNRLDELLLKSESSRTGTLQIENILTELQNRLDEILNPPPPGLSKPSPPLDKKPSQPPPPKIDPAEDPELRQETEAAELFRFVNERFRGVTVGTKRRYDSLYNIGTAAVARCAQYQRNKDWNNFTLEAIQIWSIAERLRQLERLDFEMGRRD
ncbi:MAG: hypothetical protein LBD29_10610 [Treponema sp.]|jgi:hypothetical protein|nr:hypothetical protein [Treponema sp.]